MPVTLEMGPLIGTTPQTFAAQVPLLSVLWNGARGGRGEGGQAGGSRLEEGQGPGWAGKSFFPLHSYLFSSVPRPHSATAGMRLMDLEAGFCLFFLGLTGPGSSTGLSKLKGWCLWSLRLPALPVDRTSVLPYPVGAGMRGTNKLLLTTVSSTTASLA